MTDPGPEPTAEEIERVARAMCREGCSKDCDQCHAWLIFSHRVRVVLTIASVGHHFERDDGGRMRCTECGQWQYPERPNLSCVALRSRDTERDRGVPYGEHISKLAEVVSLGREDRERLRDLTAERDRLRGALRQFYPGPCPACSGDCESANPPVVICPMQMARAALATPEHPANVPEWREIASAPRDGTYVDVRLRDGPTLLQIYWCDDDRLWAHAGIPVRPDVVSLFESWHFSTAEHPASDGEGNEA